MKRCVSKLGDLEKWVMKIVIKNLTQNIIQSIMMKINIMMIEIIDNHFITEMKKDHIKNSIKIDIEI